jgi:hypothetical protein
LGLVRFDSVPGATRFALAPGFHISRLWRWLSYFAPLALAFIFRAFGAGFHISRLWRWLSYFAPLALAIVFRAFGAGFHISRLWRFRS